MALPKTKVDPEIKTRTPQKKTQGGIFDNLRSLPHPVEEILGIYESPYDNPSEISAISESDIVPKISTVSESNTDTYIDTVSQINTVSQTKTGTNRDTVPPIKPVRNRAQSLKPVQYRGDTVAQSDTVSPISTVPNTVSAQSGFLELPHFISDVLAPSLKPAEWAVYFQLYRLSHGWGRPDCIIGYKRLSERTNIKKTALRETLDALMNQGLIKEIETLNTKEIKGTRYRVLTRRKGDTVLDSDTVSEDNTVSRSEPNKRFDHDLSKKDHHQAASDNPDEKQKATMMMYEELTGKKFNKTDESHYSKVSHLEAEEIVSLMQIVHQRASQPIGSFAYFAKGIITEKEAMGKGIDSYARLRACYQKIIGEIQSLYVGANLTTSDLVYKIKSPVIRDGLTWSDDIVNQLLGI